MLLASCIGGLLYFHYLYKQLVSEAHCRAIWGGGVVGMGSGDSHCNIALGPSDGARFYMRGMNESATMVLASVVVVSK